MIPIIPEVRWRALRPGQRSEVHVVDLLSGEDRVVFSRDDMVLEAPNWSRDGLSLLMNAAGTLFRLDLASRTIAPIAIEGVDDVNNDHVISPDGHWVYVSSEGDGHVYRVPSAGGRATRLTPERPGPFGWFVLGVSHDGERLSLTGAEPRGDEPFVSSLFLMSSSGGETHPVRIGDADSVGGEFSRDSSWLYFSSELRARRRGDAQIYRVRLADGDVEQLTHDDRVNWFPKPSPDESMIAYLSFPPGTVGHAVDVPVLVRLLQDGAVRDIAAIRGGQGTMNVTSWAPDGARFAYIAYPFKEDR